METESWKPGIDAKTGQIIPRIGLKKHLLVQEIPLFEGKTTVSCNYVGCKLSLKPIQSNKAGGESDASALIWFALLLGTVLFLEVQKVTTHDMDGIWHPLEFQVRKRLQSVWINLRKCHDWLVSVKGNKQLQFPKISFWILHLRRRKSNQGQTSNVEVRVFG